MIVHRDHARGRRSDHLPDDPLGHLGEPPDELVLRARGQHLGVAARARVAAGQAHREVDAAAAHELGRAAGHEVVGGELRARAAQRGVARLAGLRLGRLAPDRLVDDGDAAVLGEDRDELAREPAAELGIGVGDLHGEAEHRDPRRGTARRGVGGRLGTRGLRATSRRGEPDRDTGEQGRPRAARARGRGDVSAPDPPTRSWSLLRGWGSRAGLYDSAGRVTTLGIDRVGSAQPSTRYAVDQLDAPAEAQRELRAVRDHDERGAVHAVHLEQQLEHLIRGLRIEIAGRLVGEHEARLEHERARHRHALALAAGELADRVVHAVLEPHLAEQAAARARASRTRAGRRAGPASSRSRTR